MRFVNSKPAWNVVSFAVHMPTYKVVSEYEAYIRLYKLWIEESTMYINWLKTRNLIEDHIDTEHTANMMCALIDGMIKQSNVLGRPVTFRSMFDALYVFVSGRKSG